MNYERLVGTGWRPYRVFAWFLVWLTLGFAGLTFAGLGGWPWRVASLQPYLLRDAGDNWLHNAFAIYGSNDGDSQNLTKIVYVGGSVCLESLPSDQRISEAIAARIQQPVRFTSICSPYQNFGDEARIVDALGGFSGLLILGTEPVFFSKSAQRQFEARARSGEAGNHGYFYLPISTDLRSLARDEGVSVGFLADARAFWNTGPEAIGNATRRALRDGPIELKRHRIDAYRDLDYPTIVARMIRNYRESANVNEALRRHAIRSAVANGNRVALLEIPNDEALLGLFDPLRKDYDERIERMVNDFALHYLVAQTRARWTRRDFFDTHHLSPAGREKFVPVLADLVAPVVSQR